MKQLLTPKQVARAIQVSESSIKRWCDRGTIPAEYTAGGHRRIPLAGVLEFLRGSKFELVRPEVLGLPATAGRTNRVIERAAGQMREALLAGDQQACRQICFDLYLAGHSLVAICDDVLCMAFHEVGEHWECGTAEVFQERRGCEICLHVLNDLRAAIPAPAADRPLAIGATPALDNYTLATNMVELALLACGWRAVSLGSNLPFRTLRAAIERQRPRLFWLSVSYLADRDAFVREYAEFYDSLPAGVAVVLGGRELDEPLRQQIPCTTFCANLRDLESFVATIA